MAAAAPSARSKPDTPPESPLPGNTKSPVGVMRQSSDWSYTTGLAKARAAGPAMGVDVVAVEAFAPAVARSSKPAPGGVAKPFARIISASILASSSAASARSLAVSFSFLSLSTCDMYSADSSAMRLDASRPMPTSSFLMRSMWSLSAVFSLLAFSALRSSSRRSSSAMPPRAICSTRKSACSETTESLSPGVSSPP